MKLPFDRIYCVSLPRSAERRLHAAQELGRVGISGFRFFDATDKDSPLVSEARARHAVATFPPCFRCGRKVCACENNVLIDEQVATFITYRRLWEEIVREQVGVALIVEDDIKFTDYAAELVSAALTPEALLACGMKPGTESLLRLGWALNEDHAWNGRHRFVPGLLKMSNPAFALTQAMARRLLAGADVIDTTVDMYIHQKVGEAVTSHTLMPPLAYELSWSVGAFPSLIRSKPIRAEYLRQNAPTAVEAINQAEVAAKSQRVKIHSHPILCVGHPRCGSGYMAQLCQAFGLDVGHERMGAHGISSWMFAADDERYPFAANEAAATRRDKHFDHVIQFVRNPLAALPSIMVENQHSAVSYQFRRDHLLRQLSIDLDAYENPLERALAAYLGWNTLIEQLHPQLVVQVENGEGPTEKFLTVHGLINSQGPRGKFPEKNINTAKRYAGQLVSKPEISPAEWRQVSKPMLAKLADFCRKYAYPMPSVSGLD